MTSLISQDMSVNSVKVEEVKFGQGINESSKFEEEEDDDLFGGLEQDTEEKDKKQAAALKQAGKSFKDILNKNHKLRLSSAHKFKL
jgi:hypothetical protein